MSKLFSAKPRCMSFFFHMYSHNATDMGTFNVYLTEKARNKESIIFTKTGSQGSQWIKYSVTITAKRRYQVGKIKSNVSSATFQFIKSKIRTATGVKLNVACRKTKAPNFKVTIP